ncbi:hypothetical protein FNV43_RR00106 [Rhamnella rubrinervis]|uniref:Uncharacterized protein n=1 Tax=Rhamnella rubrinervis TaxID=2594499 RepID=A0A8K0HM97_9ROSA|nr:hypothetical protein FNV43_RR00106 [Rhamnella rubrinervis]
MLQIPAAPFPSLKLFSSPNPPSLLSARDGRISKSQFRLHRRSGRAPDPTRPMNRAFEIQSSKSLCKRPRSGNPNPETLNHDNVFLNTPIRIFAPDESSPLNLSHQRPSLIKNLASRLVAMKRRMMERHQRKTTPEKPDDSVIENCGNTMESVTEKPSNGNAQDGTLKIDKHSSLYNGLMGKKLQAGLPSQCEEASIERINRDIDLTECHTSHSDAETKMVVDSFDESSSGEELILTSKNITESPSGMVVDNCWSKPPVNEQNEILDVKFSCKEQKLTNLFSVIVEDLQIVEDNIISVSTDDTKPVKNDKKDAESLINWSRVGDESEVLHQIDDPNEESIQMTPPDAEIFDKRDIEENGVDRGEYVLQKRDDGLGKSLDGLHHRNSSLADTNVSSDAKLGLESTFKNEGVSVNGSYLKPEKVLEQKLVSPMFGSNDWEIPLDKSIDSGLHTENQTCDSGILLTASLTSANDSSNDKEPSTVSPEHSTELQMSFDSGKEQLADKASEFEAFTDISRSVQGPDLSVPSCHSINCEASSREECAMSLSDHLYVYTEGESSRSVMESSDNVKDTKVDRFYQNSSPHETPISSGLHDTACRRAFEFSRNQMEDAKEVALDLIKELSHLRAIFEKSDAGANDHFVVHVNQVKKACNKASEAEEQARIRLTQMNNDLDLHCRITRLERPRVRFANCVEVNSRANFPSND